MKRVLFIIPTLGYGGAEKVLVNLVNNMNRCKFDISVQTLFDVGINRQYLKEDIHYIGGFFWYFRGNSIVMKLFTPKFLYRSLIHKQYDIVVSYLEGPASRVVSGCSDKNTKLVSWIHIEQNTIEYASASFRNIKEASESYNKYNKIICVSDSVKKDFTGLFNVKCPAEVLYNTNETARILEMKDEPVDDIIFENNVFNICSVAKVMHTKGYDRLARIHKYLLNDGILNHIYIIGADGDNRDKINLYLKENNLLKSFTFLGFKDNPYKYVSKCNLYVCSSRREGFSTAVTESLIVGTPVVSTNCSGAYELLGYHNEYGIVTENGEDALYDGIKNMLLTKGNLDYYQKAAAERGKMFNTSNTVQAVEKMLEGL